MPTARHCATLVFTLIAFAAHAAPAADKPGSHDPSLVSRFPGSRIDGYLVRPFDETHFPIKAFEPGDRDDPTPDKTLTVEGKITSLSYEIPLGTSMLEVSRSYEQALTAKGFQTVFKCHDSGGNTGRGCDDLAGYVINSGKLVKASLGGTHFGDNRYQLLKRSSPDGDVYVMVYAMDSTSQAGYVDLVVAEVAPMKTGQITVTDAAALKQGLAQQGKVALYGIFFDTAKADIKPESKPSLDELGKLLNADAHLNVYVVGHTDNQGALADNLELSQRRADAVVKALVVTYHIDAKHLLAKGVGPLAPVSSNANDPGRALNRRVELVAQ